MREETELQARYPSGLEPNLTVERVVVVSQAAAGARGVGHGDPRCRFDEDDAGEADCGTIKVMNEEQCTWRLRADPRRVPYQRPRLRATSLLLAQKLADKIAAQ